MSAGVKERIQRLLAHPLSGPPPGEVLKEALVTIQALENHIELTEQRCANAGLGYAFLYRSGRRP